MAAAESLFEFLWPRLSAKGVKSQKDLAALLGVSQPTVSVYVSGQVVLPHDKIATLISALGLDDSAELELDRLVRAVDAERAAARAA